MTMPTDEKGTIVAPAQRDLDDFAVRLGTWLGERLSASDVRVTDARYPRGAGQSHETILFDAHWTASDGLRTRSLVARIKPTSFTVFQDDMFDEQYQLMRVLHESGRVRVAEVLWFESDPGLFGAPFFVMQQVYGRVAVSHPPYMEVGWVAEATPAERARLWHNSVRELAAVQSVAPADVPFLAAPDGTTGFEQEWDRWARFLKLIDRPDRPTPVHRAAWEELRRTSPTNRPEGIVWGDARLGNIMVDDDFEVVALMDWEQPSLGGALHDLGWWLFNQRTKFDERDNRPFDGILPAEDTIALWREHTGISTADIEWYEAFAGFKTACLAVNMMDMRGIPAPGGDVAQIRQMRLTRELTGV